MAKLGILVNSISPYNFLTKHIASLKYINELFKHHQVYYGIHYQSPYSSKQTFRCNRELLDHGAESVRSIYTGDNFHSKPLSIMAIRQEAALQLDDLDVDYFLKLDDDFVFRSGTPKYNRSSGMRYLEAIHYLDNNPSCGGIQCDGYLGGTPIGYRIRGMKDQMWAMQKGMIFRNLGYGLAKYIKTGTLEETIMAYCRIEDGYFMAKLMNCPTKHTMGWCHYNGNGDLYDASVYRDFIRSHWDDPEWYYERKTIPDKLLSLYKSNGGIDMDQLPDVDYKGFNHEGNSFDFS